MTTFSEVTDITISCLIAAWSVGPGTPIALENIKFDIPDDQPWVRFIVKQNDGNGSTLGAKDGRRFKRMGMILFQIFTPLYSATYDGNALCKELIDIFEGENIQDIVFYNGVSSPTGPSGDFYQFNGSVEFSYNENK